MKVRMYVNVDENTRYKYSRDNIICHESDPSQTFNDEQQDI